jgi:hypothetical protein
MSGTAVQSREFSVYWMPAFAGMTSRKSAPLVLRFADSVIYLGIPARVRDRNDRCDVSV